MANYIILLVIDIPLITSCPALALTVFCPFAYFLYIFPFYTKNICSFNIHTDLLTIPTVGKYGESKGRADKSHYSNYSNPLYDLFVFNND